jgi:hypothetical protein
MSKLFKAKTCIYCGKPETSQTADHVFSRQLFPISGRAELPKVPACQPCNQKKSTLEHYLTTVLPFASQHPEGGRLLEEKVPHRLARNAKLHRELASGYGYIMMQEDGSLIERLTIPFEGEKLTALFKMVLRGLVYYHWRELIPQDYNIGAGLVTHAGDQFMRYLFSMKTKQQVARSWCDGLVLYEGVQSVDDPALTIWRFQIYGGIQFGGASPVTNEIVSDIWAMSSRLVLPSLFNYDR